MNRFKSSQVCLVFMLLILSVFLTTGCGSNNQTGHWLGTGLGTETVTPPDTTRPTVVSVVPVDVATGVCVNQVLSATFDKAMLASTITATGTFTVRETLSSADVPGIVTYDAGTMTATFTPTAFFTSDLNYTATITTAATDLAGNALAVDKVWSFTTNATVCAPLAPSVDLGTASTYGIAATAGVTNIITTTISGNVVLDDLNAANLGAEATCNAVQIDGSGGFGLCAGAAPDFGLPGPYAVASYLYPDAGITSGQIYTDLRAAFLSITPPAGPPAAGSLGGATSIPAGTTLGAVTGSALVPGDNYFTPGVYQSLTSIMITGDLTLDAQGDPNARFVFQSSSTIDMAAGSNLVYSRILLVNGAKASNVWWQAGTSATLGAYSEFQGNILAAYDITMVTGATSCGRLLAGAFGAGAFVFDSNIVSVPGQPFAPGGTRSTTCE